MTGSKACLVKIAAAVLLFILLPGLWALSAVFLLIAESLHEHYSH